MKREKLIYVLDDSTIISDLITRVINLTGIAKAIPFYSSESFYQAYFSKKSDLYIIDYYLNSWNTLDTSGDKVIEVIRRSSESPVILVSGSSELTKLSQKIRHSNVYTLNKEDDDFFDKIEAKVNNLLMSQT